MPTAGRIKSQAIPDLGTASSFNSFRQRVIARIKTTCLRLGIYLMPALLIQSCVPGKPAIVGDDEKAQSLLLSSFVTAGYGQDLKELGKQGINPSELKQYVSVGYLSRLNELSETYQAKYSQFSDPDKMVLSRVFTSEMNFSLLRPWSYQPEGQFRIASSSDVEGISKTIVFSYVENRWKDPYTVDATAFTKIEKGVLKMDNIRWNDDPNAMDLQERLKRITRALKDSTDMNDFEKRSAGLY
jgi:hypothetical protein